MIQSFKRLVNYILINKSHIYINHFYLESLSTIKFAAYRVACKLRALQKYLKCKLREKRIKIELISYIIFLVTYVDYNVLVRAFNIHQLQFGVDTKTISLDDVRKVLTAIYQLISSYHFNELSIEETVETLLKFLYEILDM
jgi:uncharacterized membrane protein (DUF485 family)